MSTPGFIGGAIPPQDSSISDQIQGTIRAWVQEENELLESWCIASLHDPERRGILIITHTDFDAGRIWTTYELSAEVPWKTIHRYPDGRKD